MRSVRIMENSTPDRRTVAHSSLTASQRTQRARLAALSRHSRADGVEATQAARTAFLGRFEQQVDPEGVLPPMERARRADLAKRAHFQAMAFARHRKSA